MKFCKRKQENNLVIEQRNLSFSFARKNKHFDTSQLKKKKNEIVFKNAYIQINNFILIVTIDYDGFFVAVVFFILFI